MSLRKLVFRILPLDSFVALRRIYRLVIKKANRPLSETEFRTILAQRIGIKEGSVVFIHSSFDTLNLSFSVYRLLEILLETVGANGTLLFPAWHFTIRAEEYLNKGLVFDVKRSPSVLGLLSEIARRHPSAVRSIHPINSIVAIGKHAEEMINDHGKSIYPCDETSPYYKIIKYNGIIAGLGVDTNFLSFVHCPEDVIKQQFPVKTRLDTIFEAKVKMQDGSIKIIKTLTAHPQIKYRDINTFLKKYISHSICNNFSVKGNRFFYANSKELFDSIVELSKENKTIYTNQAIIRNLD
jgi:aminoglycoside 3-N-acetyltransferase